MSTEPYPECEKVANVKDKSQAIGEFLEWLRIEKGIIMCERRGESDSLVPSFLRNEQLLADFFDIDLDLVEKEKRAMLEELRNLNANGDRSDG